MKGVLSLFVLLLLITVRLYAEKTPENRAEVRYVGRVGISANQRNLFRRGSSFSLNQPRPRTVPGLSRKPTICKNGVCEKKTFSDIAPQPTMSAQALNALKNNFPSISALLEQTAPGNYDSSFGTYGSSISTDIPLFNAQVAETPQFQLPQKVSVPQATGQLHSLSGGPGGGGGGGGGKAGGGAGGGGGGKGGGGGGGGIGNPASQLPFQSSLPSDSRSPSSLSDSSPRNGPRMMGDTASQPGQNLRPYYSPEKAAEAPTQAKKWNLAFQRKNGVEIAENLCGGTPVAKRREKGKDSCTFAFYTAGHCVQDDFYQMRLQRLGDSAYHQVPKSSVEVESAYPANDVALLYFEAQCDFIADNEIGKLADINEDGTVKFDRSKGLGMIAQDGQLIAGTINPGIKHEGNSNLVADIASGPETRGGDSGSFIVDSSGHIVGPLSGSSKNRPDFSFSPYANQWALGRLAHHNFFQAANDNPLPSLAGNRPTGQPLEMPRGTRPAEVASRSPLHESFKPVNSGAFQDRVVGALPQALHGSGQVRVKLSQPTGK